MSNIILDKSCESPRLTIAIPTFNRASYLKLNLGRIFSQLTSADAVEVIVIDNASTDDTFDVCKEFLEDSELKYIQLKQNMGMAASQYECFARATGKYLWILSDDDFIEPNAIKLILRTISSNLDLYAFNYKSNVDDASPPIGPRDSHKFELGYELMNFRSVGHMSGLVYHTNLALIHARKLWDIFPLNFFNTTRGIFGLVFASLAHNTSSSAHYEGKVLFSATEQKNLDYNGLILLCLTVFINFRIMHKLEIVGDKIYKFQIKLISARIRRSYIRWYPTLNDKDAIFVDYLLTPFFSNSLIDKLIFRLIKIKFIKNFLLFCFKLVL